MGFDCVLERVLDEFKGLRVPFLRSFVASYNMRRARLLPMDPCLTGLRPHGFLSKTLRSDIRTKGL